MAKSLVTGGAGFIGSHVATHLLNMQHEVIILDDLSGGNYDNVPNGASFIEGSITDQKLISQLFATHEFDYIYHFAAYAAEGLSHFIRNFNYQNNLMGSINLINMAVKYDVKCFVFASSIAVYGSLTPPMRETDQPCPEDPYGIAKYAVEMDLKAAHEQFGLNYVIFRPHNVYGENQNIGDRYRNVVGIFMNQLLQESPLTVYGSGEQTRAFSYIDDVAPHIALSVELPEAYNQVFNIGNDTHTSVNELATIVCKVLGREGSMLHIEARNEVEHAYADHSKVNALFGTTPETTTPLEEGLQKMADWALKHGVRKTPRFENIEILKNIPPIWLEE